METTLLVPIVIGVVEIVKRTGTVDIKYIPLVALVIGTFAGLINGGNNFDAMFQGIIIGLSAAGLWDFAKSGVIAGKELVK